MVEKFIGLFDVQIVPGLGYGHKLYGGQMSTNGIEFFFPVGWEIQLIEKEKQTSKTHIQNIVRLFTVDKERVTGVGLAILNFVN